MHQAVARATCAFQSRICFALKNRKKLCGSDNCWTMKLAKCARYCSESLVSHKNCKNLGGLEHFWKLKLAKFVHSLICWLQRSFIQ